MAEHQLKGLCYNYDEKYFSSHKCKEKGLFMAIFEDILEEDIETPLVSKSRENPDITPTLDPPKVEPIISLNALTGFSAPQTLKLIVEAPIILSIGALSKKLIATSMLSTISKSWLPMAVPWNVEGAMKMCVSKSVTTT